MDGAISFQAVEALIQLAIVEDIGAGDITGDAIFSEKHSSRARIISKGWGLFCGSDMISHVYASICQRVSVDSMVRDGSDIVPGSVIAELAGPTRSLLRGERIVLNFIQRMSGISTVTRAFVELTKESGIRILDTRKTVPGFRLLDKYAVKAGGGTNHRMGLFDMVMIKDNHIEAAGSVSGAISMVRRAYGARFKIEVEAATIGQVQEAAEAGVDIIMLDNMDTVKMVEAVEIIDHRAQIEISGTMNEEKIRSIIGLGVDFVSIGSLTHSVNAFDHSLEFIK